MADIITTQDPLKPGVVKLNGPTITAGSKLPLSELDTTGASANDVVTLVGGVWTPQAGAASSDTASNLGGGEGVFASKVGADFQFKSLAQGSNVTLSSSGTEITISSTASASNIAIFSYRVNSGVNGGTGTTGSFQTRPINTEDSDVGGFLTVNGSNQLIVAAGTYEFECISLFGPVANNCTRLQNITDGTTTLLSTSGYSTSASTSNIPSFIVGRFTIAVQKTFEVQYRIQTSSADNDLGASSGFQQEVYLIGMLRKVG